MSDQPSLITERVDDVLLLLHVMSEKLGYAQALDAARPRHGNWQGLSLGQVLVTWLSYILSECRHTMQPVQPWTAGRQQMLRHFWDQDIRETDLSDDRLAEVLRILSLDEVWQAVEQETAQRAIRVYALRTETVRLDATSVNYHGGDEQSLLFRKGHSKDYRQDLAQFKLMLASLDPLGLPLAVETVPGNAADDGLYVPLIRRVRTILGAQGTQSSRGLLYVGDCKMGALATRAYVHSTGDFYLLPLAQIGQVPEALAEWVQQALTGKAKLTTIYAADGQTVLGEGYEITRAQAAPVKDEGKDEERLVEWVERVVIVHSRDYIQACYRKLERALARAEAALEGLTRPPGHGRSAIEEEAALLARADEIVTQHKVKGLLTLSAVRHTRPRPRNGRQGRQGRSGAGEEQTYFTLAVQRDETAIAEYQRTLGWRAYATNAPRERLSLEQMVLTYRDEWLIERNLARVKGRPLSLSPAWLTREDHVIGLTRLLILAARVLALIEYQVRQQLQAEARDLAGLYDGQATRRTERPTTERLLKAFRDVNLTIIHLGSQVLHHVTPLSELQQDILRLLDCPPDLYSALSALMRESGQLRKF